MNTVLDQITAPLLPDDSSLYGEGKERKSATRIVLTVLFGFGFSPRLSNQFSVNDIFE
jgi:hypothetical protein